MPPPSAAATAFLRCLMPLWMRLHTRWYMKYNIFSLLFFECTSLSACYFLLKSSCRTRAYVDHREWWRLNTHTHTESFLSLSFIGCCLLLKSHFYMHIWLESDFPCFTRCLRPFLNDSEAISAHHLFFSHLTVPFFLFIFCFFFKTKWEWCSDPLA